MVVGSCRCEGGRRKSYFASAYYLRQGPLGSSCGSHGLGLAIALLRLAALMQEEHTEVVRQPERIRSRYGNRSLFVTQLMTAAFRSIPLVLVASGSYGEYTSRY